MQACSTRRTLTIIERVNPDGEDGVRARRPRVEPMACHMSVALTLAQPDIELEPCPSELSKGSCFSWWQTEAPLLA